MPSAPALSHAAVARLLEPGDIVVTSKRGKLSGPELLHQKINEFAQGTKYTHAALFDGKSFIHATFSGVKETPIEEFNEQYNYRVYRPKTSEDDKQNAIRYAREAVGKPYSFGTMLKAWTLPEKGAATFKQKVDAQKAGSLICSNLISSAYPSINFANKPAHLVVPKDLVRSKSTKFIAEARSEQMKKSASTEVAEHEKLAAILGRLARLGATDIPGTPRLLMRQRSPGELANIQSTVDAVTSRHEAPLKSFVEKGLSKIPNQKVQGALRSGAHAVIENPESLPLQAVPVPGLTPMYLGGKKLLERGLDKAIGGLTPKTAFATSQYSTPLNPTIESGASDLPAMKAPQLRRAIQKTALPKFLGRFFSEPTEQEQRMEAAKSDKELGIGLMHLAPAAGAIGLISADSAPSDLHTLLGSVHVMHGTTPSAADSIRTRGLDPSFGGVTGGGGSVESGLESPNDFAVRDKNKAFVTTKPSTARTYADVTTRASKNPYGYLSSQFRTLLPGVGHALGRGEVLSGAIPHSVFQRDFKPDKAMPDSDEAFFTRKPVDASVFKRGLKDAAKDVVKDPKAYKQYLQSNPKQIAKAVGRLGAAPAGLAGAYFMGREGLHRYRQGRDTQAALEKKGHTHGSLVFAGAGVLARAGESGALGKLAASAPTRGNFMMASDIPAFRQPQLGAGIQKNSGNAPTKEKASDMLPDGLTYDMGDFKRAKFAMSMEQLAHFVALLRKEAAASPALAWNPGVGGNPHRQQSDLPTFRAPRLDQAIQKEGMTPAGQLAHSGRVGAPKASAPPGPSIAQIAKPKGMGFGSGISGAFKSVIGGTGPVGIK